MVAQSDHPLVECLDALHLPLADVFDNILDPEFKNGIHIFKEKSIEATQARNLRMTLKVHVLVHHVPKYVRHTRVPLEFTSVQALVRQHRVFDSFYHRFEANCTNLPPFDNAYFPLCNIIKRATCKYRTFYTFSFQFELLQIAGRGQVAQTTQGFVPLGVLLVAFIPTANRISFEKLSLK